VDSDNEVESNEEVREEEKDSGKGEAKSSVELERSASI
jgi:hypothetical protein